MVSGPPPPTPQVSTLPLGFGLGAIPPPALQWTTDPQVQALPLLWAMGVHVAGVGASVMHTLPGWWLWSQFSPRCVHSLVSACCLRSLPGEHCPRGLRPPQGVQSPHGALDLGLIPPTARGSAGWPGGEETEAVAGGEFPKVSPTVFFFLRKSSCSILLLHTRKGLSSHTAHLSS